MSRIGKLPVTVPSGVKTSIAADGLVLVEGPRGKLSYRPGTGVKVLMNGDTIVVERTGQDRQSQANYGTTRAILNNMVTGVSKGWKRSLELHGVGYTAKLQGSTLVLSVGFSHDVKMELPNEVKAAVNKNVIELECNDRQLLGVVAARIRKVQPPEPYLGKGIKYAEETIRRKAGKTGKK